MPPIKQNLSFSFLPHVTLVAIINHLTKFFPSSTLQVPLLKKGQYFHLCKHTTPSTMSLIASPLKTISVIYYI